MKISGAWIIIAVALYVCDARAQSGIFAAGGNGQNMQGILAFSLGEVFVEWGEWDTLQSAGGIQQAYDNSITVGILDNIVRENVQIFPNPCMDEIEVRFPVAEIGRSYLELRDVWGRLCDQQPITSRSIVWSIEAFSSGMYYIVWVVDDLPRASFPLIKK